MRLVAISAYSLSLLLVLAALAAAQDASKRPRSESAALFDQLDANHDSTLTKDEVPERRQRLFTRLVNSSDKDNDGKLSREEFSTGLRDQPGEPRSADQKSADSGERPADRRSVAGGSSFGPAGRSGPATMAGVAVLRALDGDRDGKVSAAEIEGAAAALKKLDKNNDGQLTRDELEGALTTASDAPSSSTRAGSGRAGGTSMLARLRELDKDKDGRFTKDELPPRLQERFDSLDTNKDGALDGQEIRSLGPRGGRGVGPGTAARPPDRASERPDRDDAK